MLAGSVGCRLADDDRLMDMLIQVGSALGPNEAWLALRGLKTFPLRMARQCESAFRIARFLEGHPAIARVRYPGLPGHHDHQTARRLFPDRRYGAMLAFDVADCDTAKAFRFLDALRLILSATTLGDLYSIMVNPVRTTHRWLGPDQQAALGIGPGTFRISVGIEGVEDLLEDLDQALRACQTA